MSYAYNDEIQEWAMAENRRWGAGAGLGGLAVAAPYSPAIVAANGIVGGRAMAYGVKNFGVGPTRYALSKAGGASSATFLIPVGMFGVQFAYDIKSYWNGQITGNKVAESSYENICSLGLGAVGGWAGAITGAEVGACFGPVGAVVGAVGGAITIGMVGAYDGEQLAKRSLNYFLGGTCDQREQLRKSFGVLGLAQTATNEEVSKRYKRLCLEKHPDKGGDKDEFIKLHAAYEIIRASRNQSN